MMGGGVTFPRVHLVAGSLVVLLGAAVLFGWAVDSHLLTSVVSGRVSMKANAALGLLLCGLALVLSSRRRVGGLARILIKAIAVFVIVGAVATISQDLFGWNLGIDQWLFEDRHPTSHSASPGRMSPTAAYCFLLIGGALWVAHWRFGSRYQMPVVVALAVTAIFASLLALAGHFATGALRALIWNYSGVAIHTGLAFLLLGCGLISLARFRQQLGWSLGKLTTAGFALGTAALLVTTLVSSHSITVSQQDLSSIARSREILTALEEVEANLARMENDQRAFLLDGTASRLDRQSEYAEPIWEFIAALRQLTYEDSLHRELLGRIGPLLAERLHRTDQSLDVLRSEGPAAAVTAFRMDLDSGLADRIEQLRDEMEEHEYEVLASLESGAEGRYAAAFLQLPLGLLLSLTILAFGLMLLDERTREQERSERTVRASQARLQLFVERAPAAIAMFDTQMRYMAVTERWLKDYRLGDRDIIGHSHYEVFPEIPDSWREVHARCIAGATEKSDKDSFRRADGTVDWIRWEIHPWRRTSGEIGGIVLFSELITESVTATERIRRLNRVYAVLSSVNSLIVRVRDRQQLFEEACRIAVHEGLFAFGSIGIADQAAKSVITVASAGTGRLPASRPLDAVVATDGRPVVFNDLESNALALSERSYVGADIRSLAILPLRASGELVGILELHSPEAGVFDEEELKLLSELAGDIGYALQTIGKQERLDFLSNYDTLTGLPNRTLFIERAAQWLAGREQDNRAMSLVILNIERFRNINEMLGRHGGDELLKQVAQRLESAFGDRNSLARLGADSFGVQMRGINDTRAVAHALEDRIQAAFRGVFRVHGHELHVSAKSGVAIAPGDGTDADALFRNAEAALKNARAGNDSYLFYSTAMNARAAQALLLETRLRRAVEGGQFVLYYQPKLNLQDRSLAGLEALIRWNSPEGTVIPPGVFIPILEQTGLIVEVGRWALQQALIQHRTWTERGFKVPRIAVNVSAVQLQRRDFADVVIGVLQDQGDASDALELEITESVMMKDVETSGKKFMLLRGLGVHIAMDDFGTGYSALAILARLPINTLKIDRSFIIGMAENPQDFGIVTAIIGLAHSLDLRVCAEGVETEEQANLLTLLNCDEAQGYLFSKPVPAAEVEALLLPPVERNEAVG